MKGLDPTRHRHRRSVLVAREGLAAEANRAAPGDRAAAEVTRAGREVQAVLAAAVIRAVRGVRAVRVAASFAAAEPGEDSDAAGACVTSA
jgi:hypothetical protein